MGLDVECQLLRGFDDSGIVSPNIIESPEHKIWDPTQCRLGAIVRTEKQVKSDWIGRANMYFFFFLQKFGGMDFDTVIYHHANPPH
jgi:hypothetical protein